MVSHTPLFSIPYPAIIQDFLRAIFDVVTFDPFNSATYLEIIFELKDVNDYDAYNDRYEFVGYNTSNFVYSIGPPIFVLMFNISLVFIYLLIPNSKFTM